MVNVSAFPNDRARWRVLTSFDGEHDVLPAPAHRRADDPQVDAPVEPHRDARRLPAARCRRRITGRFLPVPLYDPTQRFAVGARFACLRCRLRTGATACPSCGSIAVDLRDGDALARVTRVAVRRRRARNETGTPRDERVYTTVAHTVAAACAVLAGLLGSRFHTGGLIGLALTVGLAAILGFIGGYILTAMTAVLTLLLATFVAASGSLMATAVALPVLLPLYFLGPRARPLARRIERMLGFTVHLLFAPVRSLRGIAPLDDAFSADEPTGLHAPADPLRLRAPGQSHGTLEGILTTDSGTVSLGNGLSGPIVGVVGTTLGTGLRDALVAPLVVRTDAGETLGVRLDAGEVRVRGAARSVMLGDGMPGEWGIPRRPTSRRGRRRFPAVQAVDAWVVPAGARVRLEGGTLVDEANAGVVASYRSTSFVRVLLGTRESPVVLTVLEAETAR